MSKINLDDLNKSMRVRQLLLSDYEDIVALQKESFPDMVIWTNDQLSSQIAVFPEGQLGVEFEGQLIGTCSSLIIDIDEYSDSHSWNKISDNGYITNHDDEGDTLYGIEIMVAPEFRSMRVGRRLYDARKELAKQRNLKRIVIGGRIPNYHKVADEMSVYDYVEAVIHKRLYDPVLTFQISNGFTLKRIITNYLDDDSESKGYALLLEWPNLHYRPRPAKYSISALPVRICSVQYQMRPIKNFDEFAHQCEYFVDVASSYNSDFVLFPEIFTLQLLSFMQHERPGLMGRKIGKFTSNYIDLFQHLAIKYAINIIGGSHYTEEQGDLYNISYLFQRDGKIGKQYKIHITGNETRWWGIKPGSEIKVFDTDRGRISIHICYDIEFPEASRLATRKGSQLFFVPFCTDERHGYLRVRICSQARAIENQVYVATAGCVGNLPAVENLDINYAQSGIYTPSDFPFSRDCIAGECQPNIETVVIADVDLDVLKRNRQNGTVLTWRDRRLDLYDVIEKKPISLMNS
jgi:predicted amidohydrolase/ribosomal protein S18 acetylase RimI-like enzyme